MCFQCLHLFSTYTCPRERMKREEYFLSPEIGQLNLLIVLVLESKLPGFITFLYYCWHRDLLLYISHTVSTDGRFSKLFSPRGLPPGFLHRPCSREDREGFVDKIDKVFNADPVSVPKMVGTLTTCTSRESNGSPLRGNLRCHIKICIVTRLLMFVSKQHLE